MPAGQQSRDRHRERGLRSAAEPHIWEAALWHRANGHAGFTFFAGQRTITTSLLMLGHIDRCHCVPGRKTTAFARTDHPLPFQLLQGLIKTQGWLRCSDLRRIRFQWHSGSAEQPGQRPPAKHATLKKSLESKDMCSASRPADPLAALITTTQPQTPRRRDALDQPGITTISTGDLVRPEAGFNLGQPGR